ncbi:SRPBCC family protein [Tropicibacter naphthalenivorans]|uniref:Polyketide cyclase / dehydrase and lipid transport n=1 Tax=Tropicibacter naphthalenivorans TaxID=441103 RepID=A0A0P1G0K3_9RHOB|nr:SRPBCC family protein [Tropicibacter naphthalenivorans]CUH75266.1 Polyketide cyclase / dehydrase and lipid transport [Tropicibacter naphthalenivorans]SMC45341.1 Polyketide cyclase / dehydrase and lipid transport [Tropicibacter naphthalenivorans]
MQLTAREDIEAPLDRVFAELSDFETVERQALRRGIDVVRLDGVAGKGAGMQWQAGFTFRGKKRTADITLNTFSPPEQMVFDSVSGGLDVQMVVDLVALSRTRTRINLMTEFKPKTLSARLLVQSLKLAKGGMDKRFRTRMAVLAKDLEDRLQRSA